MPADRQRPDTAWTALAELGVTLADLRRDARPAVPTFDEYLPQVLAAAGPTAHRVGKPRRRPSTRRARTPAELTDVNHVARTTGNDTTLDALLLRLHTETACRRAGGTT
ncbi:hypothetical protein Daura_30325 [Dactylosporangium aurantiacum]|uniref:Uncharacterized protein n=1 Tax=Dactylosporangium aurantiacum TaxID=35754 RepID=A0A9Q9IEJ1_9ACTN|nr:hypothetical protein [Dactylosporangium aurantiacum]MDG6108695.1 hypothetical protein [Dactylosporangium aurantiacum]UWZ51060.1 hypothetical protein Daura_30325 [Dactylosporangium aurantiacum]